MLCTCSIFVYFMHCVVFLVSFFFTDTPPPEIYTLSLHDALPISLVTSPAFLGGKNPQYLISTPQPLISVPDRKSTRLNSSHQIISYAVFCLKKKKQKNQKNNRLKIGINTLNLTLERKLGIRDREP